MTGRSLTTLTNRTRRTTSRRSTRTTLDEPSQSFKHSSQRLRKALIRKNSSASWIELARQDLELKYEISIYYQKDIGENKSGEIVDY
jgi:hypothetical protein